MFQTSHRWLWILMLAVGALFFSRPQSAQACNAEAIQQGEAMDNGDGSVTYEFIVSAAGRIINIDFAEGVVAEALTCGEGFVGEVGNEDGHYYSSCIVDAPTTEWTVSIWPSDVSLTRVYVDVDASADSDQDGFTTCLDCNDSDAMVNSSATEICDGLDNDCDEQVDEDTGGGVFYLDADGDGYGAGEGVQSCTVMEGYVSSSDDCDDTNPARYPGAVETCDSVDNDCDGVVDEGIGGKYYRDQDVDGYGDKNDSGKTGCLPSGSSVNNLDCKDSNPEVYPGAEEICDDMDNDCDPSTNEDDMFDEDGDGTLTCPPSMDCDDTNPDISPYKDEVCDNGVDDNCKDGIDEGCTEASPTPPVEESPTPSDPTPTLGGDDDGGDDDDSPTDTPGDDDSPAGDDDTSSNGDDDASTGGDDDDRVVTPTPVADDDAGKNTTGCGCTTGTSEQSVSWSIFVAGLVWLWRSRRRITR